MPVKSHSPRESFAPSVLEFIEDVRRKFGAKAHGEPEEQLKAPIEKLFDAFSRLSGVEVTAKGQSQLAGRVGRPDYAMHDGITPVGYLELKAPGKGADPNRFAGHDRKQWEVFKNLPNVLYTDGDCWALYRSGERVGGVVRLDADFVSAGASAPAKELREKLYDLLAEFVGWKPIVPTGSKALAAFLAPFCRLLRDAVTESLKCGSQSILRLKGELEALLFPGATDDQFADSYAQTVLFALLLARMDGADTLDVRDAVEQLDVAHLMLSRSLQFLTDESVRQEIDTALSTVCRVVAAIEVSTLKPPPDKDAEDPWLFFYEHFLAAYDPELRKKAGAYYTPLEVVHCQVRLIDKILLEEFRKPMGFVEPFLTLDPAAGTGTYLLAVVEHSLARVKKEKGKGAVEMAARSLANTLCGFEWLVGPYAVAQLRLTQALARYGVALNSYGSRVYLTNTLAPYTKVPPAPSIFHDPIAREYNMARDIKDVNPVIVMLGNPPYGRHTAGTEENKTATGDWVRYGDKDWKDAGKKPILDDFLLPAKQAGLGVHLKNLYNQYVYFIRWALWKTFEHHRMEPNGIVSFITASSYLDGDAFVGLRRHMRKVCERIDIIDLGGDSRGTHQEENVFDIQTPVCIFFAWRNKPKGRVTKDSPKAKVRYMRVTGTREEKLAYLEGITKTTKLPWRDAPDEWNAPFTPKGEGEFFNWPLLKDIMPWQSNGVQCSRTWPIAPSEDVLAERWGTLCRSKNRADTFKEGRDLTITSARRSLFGEQEELPAIESLPRGSDMEPLVRYGYRSFDRQYLLADSRVVSWPRPPLWSVRSDEQVYFATIFTQAMGNGPALTCSANIPDLHFFNGRGAKDILPLFHDAEALVPNVSVALINFLANRFDVPKKSRGKLAVDVAAYVYAILAQPAYSETFQTDLSRKEIRVPFTSDADLFNRVAAFGRRLIHIHTYGERFAPDKKGRTKKGRAKCVEAVPDTEDGYPESYSWEKGRLRVGEGVFAPVSEEVYDFEVSGLKVVQSWLGYRMKSPKGKKSSPLDAITPRQWTYAFTVELLDLLWLLEATLDGYEEQEALLREVLESPLFTKSQFPPVPDSERKWRSGDSDEDIEMPDGH